MANEQTTQTLEQAQAETVEAVMRKNSAVATQRADMAERRAAYADELKPFNRVIAKALATEMKIRRAQAKAAATKAADEAAVEAARAADQAQAEFTNNGGSPE